MYVLQQGTYRIVRLKNYTNKKVVFGGLVAGTNAGSLCSYTKSVLSVHSDKVLKRIPFAEERMTKLPIYYDVRQGKGAEQ